MEVRAASAADCLAIAEVHVAAWQAAYAGILDPALLAGLSIHERDRWWQRVLASGESELLVALAESSAAGFAAFGGARDADAPPGRAELMALYVHPRSWSTGAGRSLWLAARARLQSQGFRSVSLWVLERNKRAIDFYASAGFAVEAGSEREFEVGGTMVREARMLHAI